jgi:KaiC/GvpD/RAD55 family RecA-like ATPase
MPTLVTITLYPKVPVTRPRAEGSVVSVNFGWELLSVLTDPDEGLAVHDPDAKKGDAGYVVAAPVPGPRSNAAAQPTRVVALDYDDSPTGPNWAALERFRHVAYTTDSHTDAAPRWRVWVLLDRAYSAEEVGRAVVPPTLAGAHLRAISQPVFLPTKADALVWQVGPETAPPLVLEDWWAPAGPAPAGPAGGWTPPTRVTRPSQASTNALVTRWLSRPEGTNRLAGALGACLAEWGWSDEDVRGYVEAWFGQADPKVRKHADDAVRGARKRRAGDRIVGFPTLAEELGQAFEAERLAGADDVVEEVLRAVAAEPPGAGPAPDDPDGLWASVEAGSAPAPAELLGARVWTARDITAWDPPPIAWLSEELCLAPGAPALITGYGGSGKTTFVQHLAVAVATPGVRLLGEFSVRHGSVLHVDHEQGTDLTLRRYRRLGLRADSQLDLVSFPRWSLGDPAPEARAAFVRACQGRALVVVDSLLASCAAFLEDENASAVREPLDFLGRVSQATGAVFLVIHHSKKDRAERMTSARGSSAITDAVSVHITYEKADLSPRTNPVLGLGKVRYEPPARALDEPVTVVFQPRGVPADGGYSLAVGDSDDSEQNTPTNSLETQIIAELSDGVPKSFNQLARTIRVNRNTLSATVKTMVQEKTLEKNHEGLTLGGIRI